MMLIFYRLQPRKTVSYVKVVGREASPSKCVLFSIAKIARKRMTARNTLVVFGLLNLTFVILGGHIDVTQRA